MIYFAYFAGTVNCGTLAWGGACITTIYPIQYIQDELLKIISRKTFNKKNYSLSMEKVFELKSLRHHYQDLSKEYKNFQSKTIVKSIPLPNLNKTLYKKSEYVVAIKSINALPNNMKLLRTNKRCIQQKN